MMPLLTQETLTSETSGARPARTHTHRNTPTICLLAARRYAAESGASSSVEFSAWPIRLSHLRAGPVSSAPSTLPALNRTIS